MEALQISGASRTLVQPGLAGLIWVNLELILGCQWFADHLFCRVLTKRCIVGTANRGTIRLIVFNGMVTHLGLFYPKMLENRVHCTFILTFFCVVVS